MADNGPPTPVGSTGHAGPSTSGFRPPADPTIPQDLSIIMKMVARHQVVGSLPALSMTAAEKRKLVEASLAKGKGKAKAVDLPQDSATTAQQTIASDSDSDSSSEWESSEEEAERALEILGPEDEGEPGTSRAIEDHPMTDLEHETIKKELTELIGPPLSSNAAEQLEDESSGDSSSEEESEDEAEVGDKEFEFSSSPLPTPKLGRMTEILDEDDDPHAGDPILSLHEVPLPPVPQPPITKLPEGEKLSLAGDVISWMREKRVEAWLEKELARKATEPSEEDVQAAAVPQITSNTTEVASEAVETSPVQATPSPDQAADSSVPPNKATLVDSWAPSTSSTPATASGAQEGPANPPAQSSSSASKAYASRFTSAGTVVVRAMQSRAGSADEGWLEEGSVICWEDGRVLGTVSETFGPLTSPFYQIRLPPPPHPYPSAETLSLGTRLFYPLNPKYRTFVNMHAVRDPRFKGSDASNLYDEEIGEDEMEWSDDEAEAEAKRRRKQRRATGSATPGPGGDRGWEGRSDGGGRGGRGGRGGGARSNDNSRAGSSAGGHSSLPQRPHFDYQPDDASDFGDGSIYGDDARSERWEGSDAGSNAGGRPRPMPYDDDVVMAGGRAPVAAAAGLPPKPPASIGGERRDDRGARGGGGGRGRGGQGRDRGRGRGGAGSGRDDRRSHHPYQPQQGGQGQQWQPPSPSFQHQQNGFQPGPPGMGYPHPGPMPQYPQQNFNYPPQQQAYNPSQSFPQYPYQQGPPGQFASPSLQPPQPSQGTNGDGVAPAINPRFAAQMQMMMGQMPPMGGGNWGQ